MFGTYQFLDFVHRPVLSASLGFWTSWPFSKFLLQRYTVDPGYNGIG
jgi:hypothetical protein